MSPERGFVFIGLEEKDEASLAAPAMADVHGMTRPPTDVSSSEAGLGFPQPQGTQDVGR